MNDMNPISVYAATLAARLKLAGDATRSMLRATTVADPAIVLPTLSAAAILKLHPDLAGHAEAVELLEELRLAQVLDEMLPVGDVIAGPVISANMPHDEKVAVLTDVVELGALADWCNEPLRKAMVGWIEANTDAILAYRSAHADLHDAVTMLRGVAPFDANDHPIGDLLGVAESATLAVFPEPAAEDAVAAMQAAVARVRAKLAPAPLWKRWLDAAKKLYAAVDRAMPAYDVPGGVAYAAGEDDMPRQRVPLTFEPEAADEVNLAFEGGRVWLEWYGEGAEAPTDVVIEATTVVDATDTMRMADGDMRVRWVLRDVPPGANGTRLVLRFPSGRTREVVLPG